MEFKPFEKIARLRRECCITEKIDGTNAQITIVHTLYPSDDREQAIAERADESGTLAMYAGSRTRWVTPDDDNFGFAGWVKAHADQLWSLGPGQHFGEWWGEKIQRGYGLVERRFSLFNPLRWNDENPNRPACCGVVPTLYVGPFSTDVCSTQLERLRTLGSVAAPGFMKPEGICIYLSAAKTHFKQTLEKDDQPKGAQV